MKEFELDVVDQLIVVYEMFIDEGLTDRVKGLSEKTESRFLAGVFSLMREELNSFVGRLSSIHHHYMEDETPPTKAEAIEIVERLKSIRKVIIREMENRI